MKIYRIYDDEWEAIYGKKQLICFIADWIREHPDDFLEENNIFANVNKKDIEQYKYWLKHILTGAGYCVENLKFCKWAIEVANFTIEEINVY